tara:strand:- start:23667 stop:23831 length:165 start_codon:yes stop_codon:yes gene_type:complete
MEIETNSRTFTCDGLVAPDMHPSEGHPKVYLTMKDEETEHVCPYCSTVFVLKNE